MSNERWTDPIGVAAIRDGRFVGDPAPTDPAKEARAVRVLNKGRERVALARYPGTEWAYKEPPRPPKSADE